ncbi:OadG family protein [Ruminococcus sp. Marseille-P6503]|uniref:OadG family protein n=1 Tax=Ruminococcus sp. Marseille-P6503 TaxID=2364796 RepID=UPI000F539736|nr:OadG family protein [Ruminococcus sp. Marseille-P6503]
MYGLINVLSENVIHGSDKNLSGATVTSVVITGMVVVFIGLILLVLFVTLYGKLFEAVNRRKENKKKAENAAPSVNKPAEAVPPAPVIEDGIEEEVVAVIMGAIEAMSAQSGKRLALKSVKTVKPQRNAWAAAGIADNTRPF